MSDAYLVARLQDTVYVRAEGMASMRNAAVIDEFLAAEIADGADRACIDLSRCTGMDSTFMGTLVGYAGHYQEAGGRLVVVNPGPGNQRLLDMLGVSSVVAVIEGQALPDLQFVRLTADGQQTAVERAMMMKSAHMRLVQLSESNRAKFASFLKAIDAELQRLRPGTRRIDRRDTDLAEGGGDSDDLDADGDADG